MTRARHDGFALALGMVALSCACVAMGWRFGPGFSCTSGPWFARPPVVEHRGQQYLLTWTQGEHPFFFQPDYQVINGRLVFAMVATSSSGSLAGRHREMEIQGAENVQALQRQGAFWWNPDPEPDGTLVKLQVLDP